MDEWEQKMRERAPDVEKAWDNANDPSSPEEKQDDQREEDESPDLRKYEPVRHLTPGGTIEQEVNSESAKNEAARFKKWQEQHLDEHRDESVERGEDEEHDNDRDR